MNTSTTSAQSDATCPICKAPLNQPHEPAAEANSLAAIDIYAVPLPKEDA